MKKFLVIQTAFLGDVILATPVVTKLAAFYPGAQIDFLVRKGNESLLQNNPFIHEVFVFNKKEGKLSSMKRLIHTFRANKYDEVINLQRFASSGIITAFSGAKSIVGFKKNPLSFLYSRKLDHSLNGQHEVLRNLSCIAHHGSIELIRPSLYPSPVDEQFVQELTANFTTPYFCLAPASVWFTKQLPVEKWVELGQQLAKVGQVCWLGGKEDVALCQAIADQVGSERQTVFAGKLSLLQSGALMRNAQRNYVNDSGPMHIASAMNAPVTAFYCSTIPAFGFGPLSDDSEIRETPIDLSCRPCGLHGYKACPQGNFACGMNILLKD